MKRRKSILCPAHRALFHSLLILAAIPTGGRAGDITVGEWTTKFVGVDIAAGQLAAPEAGEVIQQVLCVRVDLSNPEVKLFTTPKCTDCTGDTRAENTSRFLERNDLQVAVNGGFYSSSGGGGLVNIPLGTAQDVFGLAISEGAVVSPADNADYRATLLFTSNNVATFLPNAASPDTTGIYTAISGNRPLLIDGVNANTPNPGDRDPRTALGISPDRRYLYLLTVDGRQSDRLGLTGWSAGADWYETGEWLRRFGAWDAINVDGGGSTTMVVADTNCGAFRTNRSSFVAATPTRVERIVGHNFGVRAPRIESESKRSVVTPGTTTATITWQTDFPASTQVEYGTNAAYGQTTPRDGQLVRHHVATLTGLAADSSYHFRVVSESGGQSFTEGCRFNTLKGVETSEIFGLTKEWRYTTNNMDGLNWKSEDYDDSGWSGPGPGLFYVQEPSAEVAPRNTPLPPNSGTPPRTYYFRTRFNFTNQTAGLSLLFLSHIDDGAVFYLNGAEIMRIRMASGPVANNTLATNVPCTSFQQSGDARTVCPDLNVVSGSTVANNIVRGENVLAVELHNSTGSDLVFGTALSEVLPIATSPTLNLISEGDQLTLFWNGEGFVLQESTDLGSPQNWSDVQGPVTTSPFRVTRGASNFYRLRN